MDIMNSFKSFLLMTIVIVFFTNGINAVIDPTLPVPVGVDNITPNQRTFVTIAWSAPPNYFYPSYNLYYRQVNDPTFREITGIQGYSYKLSYYTNNYITPSTAFVFQVSGVSAAGTESNPSLPVPAAHSVTTQLDPKRNPAAGIQGTSCVINTNNNVFCSWTAGANPVSRINFRVKCVKPNGDNRIIRKFVFGTARTSIEIFDTPRLSVCSIEVHPLYLAVATTPQINSSFGKKMFFTVTTPAAYSTY